MHRMKPITRMPMNGNRALMADTDTLDRDHHLVMLTTTWREGAHWWCLCGAEGHGDGHAVVGWAEHVANVVRLGGG